MAYLKMWHPAFVETANPEWRRTLLLRKRATYRARLNRLSKRMTTLFTNTGLNTQEAYALWQMYNMKHSYALHKLIQVNDELGERVGAGVLG